jgi:hypothetical protein
MDYAHDRMAIHRSNGVATKFSAPAKLSWSFILSMARRPLSSTPTRVQHVLSDSLRRHLLQSTLRPLVMPENSHWMQCAIYYQLAYMRPDVIERLVKICLLMLAQLTIQDEECRGKALHGDVVKRTSYWVMDELATFLEACQL